MGSQKFNLLEVINAASALEAKIRSLGVHEIRLHDDQRDFDRAVSQSLKGYVGEHFRTTLNTLTPRMFEGLTCHDEDGKALVTTAMRCDDVSPWGLGEYIRRYWFQAYRGADGKPASLSETALDFADHIEGKVAYIGDTFVDEKHRANNLAAYVVRLCILMCQLKWQPDYIYGWMANKHAYKGLFLRWGYPICYSKGFDWINAPENRSYEDLCFLGCDGSGVAQLLRAPLAVLGAEDQTSK